ncbi:MAG: N-acetylglucosamine-6-phosphate deacetylase [Lachnospiraceae bacterium]|nr:N-acetylglucosamine-6-phosphate deacetylase [Lachnospiraceae bacterium]
MIIKNADVYTEEGVFVSKDIYIEGDRFAENGEELSDQGVLDATGCYAIPGLTDIHFHGCMGYDFSDGTRAAIDALAVYEASMGVTGMAPAAMTMPEETLYKICEAARLYTREGNHQGRARLRGIHMEGPFIASGKKGAQNEAYIRKPDIALFDRLNDASGKRIRRLTLAPELEGAMELIEELGKRHPAVIVSLGHTEADYALSMEAFERGASHVTHLYNAMNPFGHRSPGLIGAAADRADVTVELICDGIHVHPAAVRAALRIFGEDRVIFISDSMRATGLGDGEYTLGGQRVIKRGQLAALPDGTIAGSVVSLMDGMRAAVLDMGIPLETAVKCAAVNPAKCIGSYDSSGSITPGKEADVVLLKKEGLKPRQVILGGKPL